MVASMEWTASEERRIAQVVDRVIDDRLGPAERAKAWKELLVALSPEIERMAAKHHLLRRCGLTGEDEPRAILVAVIGRLSDRDHDNLRRLRARLPPAHDPATDTLDHLDRIAEDEPLGDSTLRAWLHTLVSFATKDHVRHRLGWRSVAETQLDVEGGRDAGALEAAIRALPGVHAVAFADGRLTIEHAAGTVAKVIGRAVEQAGWRIVAIQPARDRRIVGTGAERLDAVTEPGKRAACSIA
jgi:hypothetical protein